LGIETRGELGGNLRGDSNREDWRIRLLFRQGKYSIQELDAGENGETGNFTMYRAHRKYMEVKVLKANTHGLYGGLKKGR